jgi:hypothetical protein
MHLSICSYTSVSDFLYLVFMSLTSCFLGTGIPSFLYLFFQLRKNLLGKQGACLNYVILKSSLEFRQNCVVHGSIFCAIFIVYNVESGNTVFSIIC